jgi:hypothetical protein
MVVGLFFNTIEEFNVVNERVTIDAKQEFELDVYATPLVYSDGFFMEICQGYEKFFTTLELESSIEYVPINNEETIEL